MEKDSVGGDTAVENRIGGVEAFETNLEEDAADNLKIASRSMTLQDSLLTIAISSSGNPQIKAYAKQALERLKFQKNALHSFLTKNKVIPNEDLRTEQIDSLRWLSKQIGISFYMPFNSQLSAEIRKTITAYKEAGHARQQRVKASIKEEMPGVEKELDLLNALEINAHQNMAR